MDDDFMNQFEQPKPPRPEFTAVLYKRITQPMKTTIKSRVLRAAAWSIAVLAVLAAVLFYSPSTRAFADSIFQQIGKGYGKVQTANDVAAASQLAGFTVLAPSYLPDGYITKTQPGEWTIDHQNNGVVVSISYNNQAGGALGLSEEMYQQGMSATAINDPEKQDVTVRGQPGTWISNGGKSLLAWDENGIAYIIGTNMLTEDEVMKVAESLGK
jgi:hypothetical protein